MKEKILEIQSYFIGKLVNGQFDIMSIKPKNKDVTIRIDNEYLFTYEVDVKRNLSVKQQTGYGDPNFMILPELTHAEKLAFSAEFAEIPELQETDITDDLK